jgi:hypothetical protein
MVFMHTASTSASARIDSADHKRHARQNPGDGLLADRLLGVSTDDREFFGFRVVLADADMPPNFGGRYVVSKDTCGSESVRLLITDAESGKVYQAFCMFWTYRYTRHDLPMGVEYRRDSTLLIAHGCFDDDQSPECGDHYYRMTPKGLAQISFAPFNPPLR